MITSRKRIHLILLLLFLGCVILYANALRAQPLSHRVEKGDTLWDICEKYYGDASLWPKLWQMNPFVTNPHLLSPGDIITLLEDVPLRKAETSMAEKEEKKEPPVKEKVPEPAPIRGIDVSSLTHLETLGTLSAGGINPWGSLFSAESGKLLLTKGDIAYAFFRQEVNPGDGFAIFRASPLIRHPVTGEKFGYTVNMNGRLVVEGPAGFEFVKGELYEKKQTYRVRITETYRTVEIHDLIIPDEKVSSCIQPRSTNEGLVGNIVSARNQEQLVNQYSVVYLDKGLDQGVQRGNLLEVVKAHIVPDPADPSLLKKKNMILPDIVIAVIMVIESMPKTSTALVLSMKEEIPNGAYVRGMTWKEVPEFLSFLPACEIQ